MLIENEQTYPIWLFDAEWLQDKDPKAAPDFYSFSKEAPEGKFWNGTNSYRMFREEKTSGEIILLAREWIQKILANEKNKEHNADSPVVVVQFVRHETCCLVWFSHYTFDTGQSDGEVLASFERFVQRTIDINKREGKIKNGYYQEPHCLMSAERRGNWTGVDDEGNRVDPPCRCKQCKEQGTIMIAH